MHAPLDLKTDHLNLLFDHAALRTRTREDLAYRQLLGISLRELRMLRLIGSAPSISMGELAYESTTEKTLASKLVATLVKGGLVQRKIGSEDARNIELWLSPQGIDLVLRAEPLGQRMEQRYTEVLGEAALDELRRTLAQLVEVAIAARDQQQQRIGGLGTPTMPRTPRS